MPATKTVLGKRKMRTKPSKPEKEEEEEEEPAISAEEAQAILRRHFEAKFKPLSPSHAPTKPDASTVEDLRSDSDNDDDDASEASWSGVSGAEDSEAGMDSDSDSEGEEIEVVSYANNTTMTSNHNGLSKREAKAYLSSRVPSALLSSSSTTTTTTTQNQNQKSSSTGNGGADEDDAPTLLKNDLALQRLLTESHLFSNSKANSDSNNNNNNTTTTTTTEHAGRNRHLATDLRLGALGSKRSIYAQQKMPMSVRKGIAGAATDRETRRRREARESGVVLERKSGTGATAAWLRGFGGGAGGKDRRRSGGGGGGGGQKGAVDAPAVGKLRNGMLTLSKRDVSEIQGGGGGSGSGGGRGGKGGKRRRR